jgi:SAM-dependent methyltransferase
MNNPDITLPSDVRPIVRERYGRLAADFQPQTAASCCGPQDGQAAPIDQVSSLYELPDVADLPPDVTGLSLGCGDPISLASLQPGQTVLDLGSGGGIDCFLAARRVGKSGRVIGVDMTPEMIEKARGNQARLGAQNVEFRLGEIEHLPVADDTVDVIISNCVINLSPDKPQVFREAFRVLKPGGRIAFSDMVTDGPMPEGLKADPGAWATCIAGALEAEVFRNALLAAGFVDVALTPESPAAQALMAEAGQGVLAQEACCAPSPGNQSGIEQDSPQSSIFSARITARKP